MSAANNQMGPAEWIGLIALVASVIAALYAGIGYHFPRVAKPSPPRRFVGELPANGPALSDFLFKNDGRVVDLDVGFVWSMDDEPEPQTDFIKSIPIEDGKYVHQLVLSDGPFIEGVFAQMTKYDIFDLPGRHMSAFASDPAGGHFGVLRGAFIPRSKGAGKHLNYAVLIQVDELNRALLDR
jgi:hypothetical protein